MKVKENQTNDQLCYFIVDGKNETDWEQVFKENIIKEFPKVSVTQQEMWPREAAMKLDR